MAFAISSAIPIRPMMSISDRSNDYRISTARPEKLEDTMAKRVQRRKVKSSRPAASICWFDIPGDDLDRAKKFYRSLFGWKFKNFPAAVDQYWHIDTGGADASPDGGLLPHMHPHQPITNYVSVPSVSKRGNSPYGTDVGWSEDLASQGLSANKIPSVHRPASFTQRSLSDRQSPSRSYRGSINSIDQEVHRAQARDRLLPELM